MNKTTLFAVAAIVALGGVAYYAITHYEAKNAPVVASSSPDKTVDVAADSKAKAKAAKDSPFTYDHFRVGNRNVKSMLADGNIMWLGTSGGVIRYDLKIDDYTLYDNKSGLFSNGILKLAKIDGELWVGTYGGGLSILNPKTKKWRNYNVPNGMGDAFVYDMLKAKNGDVWIATWSGVNRVIGGDLDHFKKWDLYTVKNTNGGLSNDWVYGLAEGLNGDIWLATEGGLNLYRNGKWKHWSHKEGLGADYDVVKADIPYKNDPAKQSSHHALQKKEQGLSNVDIAYNPNYVIALIVDKKGRVWVGTWGGGLSVFDGKTWKVYTKKDGLPANHVFMLHQDKDGNIWVGTNNGLAEFNGKTFKRYGKAQGLFSNAVFSMKTASDGTVWVGSYGGVARYYTGLPAR